MSCCCYSFPKRRAKTLIQFVLRYFGASNPRRRSWRLSRCTVPSFITRTSICVTKLRQRRRTFVRGERWCSAMGIASASSAVFPRCFQLPHLIALSHSASSFVIRYSRTLVAHHDLVSSRSYTSKKKKLGFCFYVTATQRTETQRISISPVWHMKTLLTQWRWSSLYSWSALFIIGRIKSTTDLF